jgi:hypothetical protein
LSSIRKKSEADRKLGLAAAMVAQTEFCGAWDPDSSSEDGNERSEHQFSEQFLASMEEIFQEEERQIKKEKRAAMTRVAAVFALVVFCGGAVAGGRVAAWKESIYNKFFREEVRYTETVTSEGSAQIEALRKKYPKLYLPDALPEGMKVTVGKYNEETERYNLWCENIENNQFIDITQTKTAKVMLNTEDTELKSRQYNGIDYYWTENEKVCTITWAQDGYQFVLTSSYKAQYLCTLAEKFRREITKK